MADVYGDCINETQKTFQERLLEIPAYTMTLSQLQNIYTSLKERNVVFEKTLTTGEKCVEKITTAAKPVVWAATQSALQVAKPVVGEIVDPGKEVESYVYNITEAESVARSCSIKKYVLKKIAKVKGKQLRCVHFSKAAGSKTFHFEFFTFTNWPVKFTKVKCLEK